MKEDKKLNYGPHGEGCKCPWPDSESKIEFTFIGDKLLQDTIDIMFPTTVELTLTMKIPEFQLMENLQLVLDDVIGKGITKIVSAKDLKSGEICTDFK